MKYTTRDVEDARGQLSHLKPGDKVFTLVRHKARSGMSRDISFFVVEEREIRCLDWAVSRLLEEPLRDRGVHIGGCGMDMGWHSVERISERLFGYTGNLPAAERKELKQYWL